MSFSLRKHVSTALICQTSVVLSKTCGLIMKKDRECTRWKYVNYALPKPQEADLSPWPLSHQLLSLCSSFFKGQDRHYAVSEYGEMCQVVQIWFWESWWINNKAAFQISSTPVRYVSCDVEWYRILGAHIETCNSSLCINPGSSVFPIQDILIVLND